MVAPFLLLIIIIIISFLGLTLYMPGAIGRTIGRTIGLSGTSRTWI